MAGLRAGREHRAMSEINVTPLVDVMLVLLIIFMVTAPLLQQGLDVGARRQKLDELKQDVEETAEHVVNLIVVFLLQTLIMPLVILWALYMFVKGLLISAGRRTNSGTLTVTSTGEKDPS